MLAGTMVAALGAGLTMPFLIVYLHDIRGLSLPAAGAVVAAGAAAGLLSGAAGGGLPNELAPEHLRGRYNALAANTWSLGELAGPPVAGALLGSGASSSWAIVIAVGCVLAAGAGLGLARILPAHVERPPADQPAGALSAVG